jgi:hypothetical protein
MLRNRRHNVLQRMVLFIQSCTSVCCIPPKQVKYLTTIKKMENSHRNSTSDEKRFTKNVNFVQRLRLYSSVFIIC